MPCQIVSLLTKAATGTTQGDTAGEASLSALEAAITDVERQVEAVEQRMASAHDDDEVAYLRKKEVQLRTKEEQLRTKGEQLRTEKKQLREKEDQRGAWPVARACALAVDAPVHLTHSDDCKSGQGGIALQRPAAPMRVVCPLCTPGPRIPSNRALGGYAL